MMLVTEVSVVTVAGTVYEFHVLPYSPAFKPAPAIYERTLLQHDNIFLAAYKSNYPRSKPFQPKTPQCNLL